jgi:hypothetical protein
LSQAINKRAESFFFTSSPAIPIPSHSSRPSAARFPSTVTASPKKYTFSNSARVDNEGGKVVNKIELTMTSPKAAKGAGTSRYTHPGGMTCKWGSKIALTR